MSIFATDNAYKSELFARGYIFRQNRPPEVADHWLRDAFHGFHLAHDPRLDRQRESHADCEVMSLGTIFDVRHPDETAQDCVARLAAALARSEAEFITEVGFTCGRYVLAYRRADGSCFVMPDATGMKTVFYYCGRPRIVASHHNLILANAPNGRLREPIAMKFGYPGLRAPLQRTFLLTPNTKLNLGDFAVMRFWPNRPIRENSLAAATAIVHANMQGVVDYILKRFRPVVSVTAGLDSRLTLSFLRDAEGVRHFSYYRDDNVDTDFHDIAFARLLREGLGRDVNIMELARQPSTASEFLDILTTNTVFDHIKRVAWVYHQTYGEERDTVHMRSNISEIGREFWRGKKFHVRDGKDLARIYLYANKDYKASYVFNVIEHFEEFDAVTGLTKCAGLVDLKSFFYWEFRMASWHAQVVAESDPAFDTLSVFNCRNTLEAMLSVPLQDRLDSMILRRIIAQNWPELAGYEVNGKPFWPARAQPAGQQAGQQAAAARP